MMQSNRKDIRSLSLDMLRFPLALFVVAVHIFVIPPYTGLTPDAFAAAFPGTEYLLRFVEAFIKDQSVPVYYFIAGYVFYKGMRFSFRSYTGKLKRRCHSLLIPYLVWNTVAILYLLKMYLPGIREVSQAIGSADIDFSFSAFINCFWDDSHGLVPYDSSVFNGIYPIDKPLWFVRDLMIMALIAPAIYAIYRLPVRAAVAILSAVTFIFILHLPDLGHLSLLIEAFTFFAWGGFLSFRQKDMTEEFSRFRNTSFALYPLLAAAIFIFKPFAPEVMDYVKSVNVIVGLFFFYNIASLAVTHWGGQNYRSSTFLSSASFFIYCGHFIIIDPIGKRLFAALNPASDTGMAIYLLLLYVSVIALLLAAYSLMRAFMPRFLKLFTGGRL